MKTSNKKKAIGIFLISAMFLMMAAGSGSDDDTASKVGEVTADNSTESSESSADDSSVSDTESTSETNAETAPAQSSYHVGDILQTDELKIVYMASGDYESDNEFIQPEEGNKYIFIQLYCENIGDSDSNISSYSFECYADGYACPSAYLDENELSATLSAGRSTSGKIGFEIPADAQDIQIEYEVDAWSEEKAIFEFEGNQDSGYVPEANAGATADAFKVGDIIETSDLNITYLSCAEYNSDNMFDTPQDGYHYIYCELEFENISDSDQNVSYFDFYCYADGVSCESYYGMDNALSATLSPGRKTKGTVAFEVPVNATNVEIEFLTNLWTSDRIVFTYEP